MHKKACLMDAAAMDRSLSRIAHEILERQAGAPPAALVGIERRGLPLAERLARKIELFSSEQWPVGRLNIRFYRDDLSRLSSQPVLEGAELPFSVHDRKIILVDDVLYTGRTARAAMEALFDRGRPAQVQLAVLVDRGHRELPFKADYVGKNVPSARREEVLVRMSETDGEDLVLLVERELS